MSVSAGAGIVEDGLVFCLDASLAESYSGSGATWYDILSLDNDFGLYTPTYTVNPVRAIVLLSEPWNPFYSLKTWANMGLGTNFSISCWISSTVANVGYYGAILFSSESYTVKGFRSAGNSGGALQFWSGQSGGTFHAQSGSVFTYDGKKQLITLSYNGTTAKIYHNDTLVASADGTFIAPSDIGLSNWFGGYGGSWDAQLHKISGYNRALTPTEVAQNYHQQKSKYQS